MARSSSYDFSLTRDNICNAAFRLLGVIGDSQTASATRLSQAGQALNMMIRLWQGEGIALWKNREVVLMPDKDTVQYSIGDTGDAECSLKSGLTQTYVATTAAISATSITHATGYSLSTGYKVGIELDTGDIHWANITAVVDETITIDDGLAAQASATNWLYYSTDWTIPRPMEVIQAWTRDSSGIDVPVEIISLERYRSLSNKTTEGRPNSLAFDPTLDNVTVYLWPEPDNMKELIHMIVKIPFQDFDATSDDPDFPPEWSEALVYNLAVRLAAEYGRTPSDLVTALAMNAYEILKGFSREEVSVRFVPNRREYSPTGGYR